ncbi:DUF1634 domain-containing protein [Candidimonas humi]|uniref:DUF1634 domain-containing protein n=1 Tax=Candidimonas humi TaxID=683355 RepID=A0ABV8NR14_9BURK|nr:DUF1634 domain-containing protein [Candidimonas humi]MBV6303717.1 DUF1634 domain-containing protein [Candidimonas humi]
MSEYLTRGVGQEQAIAKLLHCGTRLASCIIAAGLVAEWLYPSTRAFGLSGGGLMKAGVALFIFLPVARVGLMLIQFAQARDTAYTAISALVLMIIGAGFLAGL